MELRQKSWFWDDFNVNFNTKRGFVVIILVISFLSHPMILYPVSVDAQQVSLIVSAAEDPEQNNTFFGPQIVQIVINDINAKDSDTNTGSLTVKGKSMQRVHLTDGQWYSFIAERDSFLIFLDIMTDGTGDNKIAVSDTDEADNRNTVDSMTVVFEQADSFVREITEVDGNLFVEVGKNEIFPTLPEPFTTGAVNPDLDINPSSEPNIDWPYVRLFNIQETGIIDIKHDTIVSLEYNRYYNDIHMGMDRGSYPLDVDIVMNFKDFMWNINPVEEDVVRFILNKNTGMPDKIIYQPLRNFDPANDGLNLFDILPSFSLLDFDNRQMVLIDGVKNLKYKNSFDSSTGKLVEYPEESGIFVSEMTADQSPVVTLIETVPNTSLFSSIDAARGGRSDIFAGMEDSSTTMDYFNIITSATIGLLDAFGTADKDEYDSSIRATFTITDIDLNMRSILTEIHDGIQSRTFIQVGNPFPLTNNDLFDTLPRDNNDIFLENSIQAAKFNTISGTAETVDFDGDGMNDFFANEDDIDNRNPSRSDVLALDFSTVDIGGSSPTGFIINSNINLAQIASTNTFTMTKIELLEKVDPFIRAVSDLEPQVSATFDEAPNDEMITVTFPQYNLIHVDLSMLSALFAKVFVEIEASNGSTIVTQMVDFEPFDSEDIDGDPTFKIDPLLGKSGFGSFRFLDFINADWNADGIIGNSGDIALLSSIPVKVTVIIVDSANILLPITSATHQIVVDIVGLGVIRAEGESVDSISVDAFENIIYRLEIKEEGVNSSRFSGRSDFMTVLHSDTVKGILQDITVIGDPLKIWLPNRFVPPNRLAVSYTDLGISGVYRQVSATFIYQTRDGEVSWDQEQYRFNQVAMLTVIDEDLNRISDAIERYSIPEDGFLYFEFDKQRADSECQELIPIPDYCFIKFVEATLRETSPSSSEFRAQIAIPPRVLLENGDIIKTFKSGIRAVFVDIRDSSSNINEFHDNAIIRSDINTSQQQENSEKENTKVVEKGGVNIELDNTDYHPYSRVYVTVTATEKNVDQFRSDLIIVSIERKSDNTGINYKLVETGFNTGVFSGYLNLSGPNGMDGGIGPRDGMLKINVGDSMLIRFGEGEINIPIKHSNGRVIWDKSRYVLGETAKLQVLDPDMNKNAGVTEILKVTLMTRSMKILYELRETNTNSGIFMADIPFVNSTSKVLDKEVGVVTGEIVSAVYEDTTENPREYAHKDGKLSIEASVKISDTIELLGVNRVAQTNFKLIDDNGNLATNPKLLGSYEIEDRLDNNTEQSFQLEFIVQLTNENGIVEFLESLTMNLLPGGSISPSVDWKPSKRGEHTVEIFVWQTLGSPSPLSSVIKRVV